MVICLGWPSPVTSSSLPAASGAPLGSAGLVGAGRTSPPIWPCSDWGLPCRSLLPGARWALTPPFHPYPSPASRPVPGGLFSVALSVASRRPGVTWQSTLGARTFLEGARAPPRPSRPTRGSKLTRTGPVGTGPVSRRFAPQRAGFVPAPIDPRLRVATHPVAVPDVRTLAMAAVRAALPLPPPTVAAVLAPTDRAGLDAASVGCFSVLHRSSVPDAVRAVRERAVDAVLLSVHQCARERADVVDHLVRSFPGVPTVALVLRHDATSSETLLRLGATGVRQVVDVTAPAGWSRLRQLVAEPATRGAARIL